MPKVKQYLDEISSYLTTWITQIAVNNALTYYDINKISEGTSLHLLNLLYGYQLVDLNNDRQNFPGIDLGDKSVGKLAVQVSSRTDASKIGIATKNRRLFYAAIFSFSNNISSICLGVL